jgi:uncharacterized DUF497 family protein
VDYEWDGAKSEWNALARGLPFDLAVLLLRGPVIETIDDRVDYGEVRVRVIGRVAGETLHCVYTDRDGVRRIISLRYASRKERNEYRATFGL